jgi:hypothetical protein
MFIIRSGEVWALTSKNVKPADVSEALLVVPIATDSHATVHSTSPNQLV